MNKLDSFFVWVAKIPKDKLLHVLFGMLFALGMMRIFCIFGLEYARAWTVLSAVIIGLAKEIYDRFVNHERFDCYDWLATIIGGLVVAILVP